MKKSIQFIIVVCAVSWIITGIAILGFGLRIDKPFYKIFSLFYMLIPAICAIILQIINKEKPFRNLFISFRFNRWFIFAAIVPIIFAFITLGINIFLPNVYYSDSYEGVLARIPAELTEPASQYLSGIPRVVILLATVILALIEGCTINGFFAFGEELGWRGYLLKSLKNYKFLSVSLITGTVWGLWHFPLILLGHNYPQHRIAGIGMMIIWCILLSPVITYIVIKSKSVITAAIFHGTLNSISGLYILYITGGNDLTNGSSGIAGFIALLLINITLFLYDKYISKEKVFSC